MAMLSQLPSRVQVQSTLEDKKGDGEENGGERVRAGQNDRSSKRIQQPWLLSACAKVLRITFDYDNDDHVDDYS